LRSGRFVAVKISKPTRHTSTEPKPAWLKEIRELARFGDFGIIGGTGMVRR
jgi:hypothetical protein